MNTTQAPYLIQRQSAAGDWAPVSVCESLAYAEKVAAAGLRCELAASYRALEIQTGAVTTLAPGRTANAP